jgi:hypothetical protein
MAIEIVQRAGVKRELGYLYFLKGVDVWRVPMRGANTRSKKATRVAKGTYEKEEGYLYFLDSRGDVARATRTGYPRLPKDTRLIRALNLLRQCYTHVPAKLKKRIETVLRPQ